MKSYSQNDIIAAVIPSFQIDGCNISYVFHLKDIDLGPFMTTLPLFFPGVNLTVNAWETHGFSVQLS